MPALPDCPAPCGGPVVFNADIDGGVEECTRCGRAWAPGPVLNGIRRAVREVREKSRRGELRPMRCPPCKRREHDRCHAVRCECSTGVHPTRPEVPDAAS